MYNVKETKHNYNHTVCQNVKLSSAMFRCFLSFILALISKGLDFEQVCYRSSLRPKGERVLYEKEPGSNFIMKMFKKCVAFTGL